MARNENNGRRRGAGGPSTRTVEADDLSVDATPESLLAELDWDGSIDEFISMLLVGAGEMPGLERFKTTADQQFVVHVTGYDGETHAKAQCALFDAAAEINGRWRVRTGQPLITVSGS